MFSPKVNSLSSMMYERLEQVASYVYHGEASKEKMEELEGLFREWKEMGAARYAAREESETVSSVGLDLFNSFTSVFDELEGRIAEAAREFSLGRLRESRARGWSFRRQW
jgi:hypothetical protein